MEQDTRVPVGGYHVGFLLGWFTSLKVKISSSETVVHIRTTQRCIPEHNNVQYWESSSLCDCNGSLFPSYLFIQNMFLPAFLWGTCNWFFFTVKDYVSQTTKMSGHRVQNHVGSGFYFASGRLAYPGWSLNSHSLSRHKFLTIFFSPFRQMRQCPIVLRCCVKDILFQSLMNKSVSTAPYNNRSSSIMSHPDPNFLCWGTVFIVVAYKVS
jgi:hypothetical protein